MAKTISYVITGLCPTCDQVTKIRVIKYHNRLRIKHPHSLGGCSGDFTAPLLPWVMDAYWSPKVLPDVHYLR